MNRIIACLVGLIAFSAPALAQDAALVERVNRLSVYVEELLADKARQQKQITELTRQVESLREQVERASGSASKEEVAAVAKAVKELDQKHRADIKLVAVQIQNLGKVTPAGRPAGTPSTYERGWEYTVQQGNTLSAIASAYRADGHKVTVADILKANPGLNANKLKVGQVIFIPEP